MSTSFELQNTRSPSKNFAELSQLVCKKDPLVVALTETGTTKFTNSKLFQIETYPEVILCNQKKRGGFKIYLENNLEFEVLPYEISNATQLRTIFIPTTTPVFILNCVQTT